MNTLILIKEIYKEGFRNLGIYLIRRFFKSYAWFSMALWIIALYALAFRMASGFAFD
jgi:hypothetical protein